MKQSPSIKNMNVFDAIITVCIILVFFSIPFAAAIIGSYVDRTTGLSIETYLSVIDWPMGFDKEDAKNKLIAAGTTIRNHRAYDRRGRMIYIHKQIKQRCYESNEVFQKRLYQEKLLLNIKEDIGYTVILVEPDGMKKD